MKIGESIVINLAQRYASAFGIMAVNNAINKAVVTREPNKYNVEMYDDIDTVFEETEFIYEVFRNNQTQVINKILKFGSMLLSDGDGTIYAPPLMIDFSREKNLIETSVSGGDGVVIERFGARPWNIDIKGILIDVENRNYPTEKIKELIDVFEHNDIITVVGQQFYEKNIDSIYIKSISINPIEGFTDTVHFSLTASSISSVSWTLLKPNE
ncbi:DUF6046 domain-containing protein [Epilithonimonas mollis]|uniref:DUF6046 domain-containing protein n=1 Tax=Epilithonimonas mollis TaxID=216903 RepID=A0A1M6UQH8_9FLAO|nr:DUF6046 domain-containing protein [Epilithonimonas mollis]SHK71421.1 hypothetical protein SAMN05444371_3417 [Epilithonimonas mollis]